MSNGILTPSGAHSNDLVIDTDRHIMETWSIFSQYCEPDLMPFVYQRTTLPDGTGGISIAGRPTQFSDALWDNPYANRMFADDRFRPNKPLTEGLDPGGYLSAMDREGIDAAIITPTLAMGSCAAPDGRIGSALCRAYARWVSEFCSIAPKRMLRVFPVNLNDVDLAIKDCTWALEQMDFAGLFIVPLPVRGRRLHHPDFDRFWARLNDWDRPVIFHTLSSLPDPEGRGPLVDMIPAAASFGANIFFHHMAAHRIEQHFATASIVAGGVLEKYPKVRVLFTEAGGGWMQSWLDYMDEHFDSDQMRRWVPWLKLRPSEYFHRQCLVSYHPTEKVEGTMGGSLKVESLCWSSDYPHHDSVFPGAVDRLSANSSGLTMDERSKLLGGNVARFLGIERTTNVTRIAART
ncbi:amidohydrolase family protein [Bradyrhizobium diazoefficiens]|uniref:amidohydrolase family protein n=1 Tax=Bradyrhizobium diazoefficiens TaxID=1355477 RepID=UPI00359C06A6